MACVKCSVDMEKKCRGVLELASGYHGQRSRLYRRAKERILHSVTCAYRDRQAGKGGFRTPWIRRINAAAHAEGMTYNHFANGLKSTGVQVDCKILTDLAVTGAEAFNTLVIVAREDQIPTAV